MLDPIRKRISLDNPFRLLYHKFRAIFANIIYKFPSNNMVIIGVTGTNGKTTTCNIIAKGLRNVGKKVFMFSTVNIIIGDNDYVNETKMTSPDPMELQRLLAIAKSKGCDIAVIETASHGIKMDRVWGLEYDICVLTNITQDHMDLHGDMDDYINTKLKIFKKLITYKRKTNIKKTAIINIDSEHSKLFTLEAYDFLYTYGNNYEASLKAIDVKHDFENTKFMVTIPGGDLEIETKLKGEFNIYNILAAIGVFISIGVEREKIREIIKDIVPIAGRMEEVSNNGGYKIYVDYAHTPDAIEKILEMANSILKRNNVITVFGATGDRDKTKRPIMGQIVSANSNKVILTQDDDYTEPIEEIIKDVLPGIERKQGENFWVIPERKEAIRTALLGAKKGDIVLILGKGDEHTLITNKGPIKWHDKAVIKEILRNIDDNKPLSSYYHI